MYHVYIVYIYTYLYDELLFAYGCFVIGDFIFLASFGPPTGSQKFFQRLVKGMQIQGNMVLKVTLVTWMAGICLLGQWLNGLNFLGLYIK